MRLALVSDLVDSVDATRAVLSKDELAFIQTFQRTLTLDEAFLYHGTPRSNVEDPFASTRSADRR